MNRFYYFFWLLIMFTGSGLMMGCATGTVASATTPQLITLHAQDIRFDPTQLTVKAKQPVQLTYINEGLIDHAFAIEGLVEEQKIKPGQSFTFRFTPQKVGEFTYSCSMPGHESAGMVGTLVVQP